MAAPCDQCGGTVKKHAIGCPATLGAYQGRDAGNKKCGSTHDEAGNQPHLTHRCDLIVMGERGKKGASHPGSHVCYQPGCAVTW